MKLKSKKFIVIALVVLVALALVLVLAGSPPSEWDSAQRLGAYIQSQGVLGYALFLVACSVATAFGLPRQFFAFAAGFAYGVGFGVFLSSLGAIVGCAATFFCSRHWLSARIKNRYPNGVSTLNSLVEKDAFWKIIALRLQPLGTNLLTNVTAGVTSISAIQFLLSSWIGYLPQMLAFALLGAGVRIGSNTYVAFSMSMLVLSLAIGYWLYRRTLRQKVLG